MAPKKVKSDSESGGRKVKRYSIEMKKEIIEKHARGVRVSNLALEYGLAKSTICTFLKHKETIQAADVAKGVIGKSKKRSEILEKVEQLLLVWINEKQLKGDSVNEAIICGKARQLHGDLLPSAPSSSSAEPEEFKASRGWFENFRKRSGIHSVVRHGEAASANKEGAEKFVGEFAAYVESEGFIPQQVFNCDETGLFWKKMPSKTYITQEEKKLPGHKPMKDRFTLLLCANASGDCRIKPLLVYHSENPRVFKKNNVHKARLPVMWRSNAKAWVTRIIFVEWITEVFAPAVKRYLEENDLPLKCLLVLDNAPAHPPGLEDDLDAAYNFISVKFLPPNTTPLLQPMDQQVISNFKKLYTKALFSRCFQVTNDTDLTLREFWKHHFHILHCINLVGQAWNEVSLRTLRSAWKKLWPSCVAERDFEGFGEAPAETVVDEIVTLGKGLGLNVNSDDVEELLEDHKEELTTEDLLRLKEEQVKDIEQAIHGSSEDEEEREEILSDELQKVFSAWGTVQMFVEKHHPDQTVTSRALNIMNDNVLSHFRKLQQKRRRQITLDRFLVQKETSKRPRREETPERQESEQQKREKTPAVELPSVLMEGDSPSKQ